MVYWEYQQLDLDLFTSEYLDNPQETLKYSLKVLNAQQEHFEQTLPQEVNLGLLKLNAKNARTLLQKAPKDIMLRFQQILPDLLRKRNLEVKAWMDESTGNLKSNAPNIDEFVKKMASLKGIQKVIEKFKNKLFVLELMYQVPLRGRET